MLLRATLRLVASGWMLSALAVLPSCATRPQPEVEQFNKNQRVDAADFPDAPAVILLDRTEVTYFPPPQKNTVIAEVVHTRRIQVVTEAGTQMARQVVPFDQRTHIVNVTGRVIHPDGSVDEMHPNATVDVDRFKDTDREFALYEGKGHKAVKLGDAHVGDVLEVSVLSLVRDPRWLPPMTVGGDLPFVRGEVVVNVPKGFDVDTRVTKQGRVVSGARPQKIPTRIRSITEHTTEEQALSGMRLVHVFDREPALFPEGQAPDASARATQVHVQLLRYQPDRGAEGRGFQGFDDVAAWYRELTRNNDQPTVGTKTLAQAMARGSKTDKLRAVQRFVQDQIADVPTFLHLAALPSHSADTVARAKIGDSKDQANLTLALLRSMGIDGFAVLVSRAGSFASVLDLPTPAALNHVVIAVPQGGSYAFIDPSTPFLPMGRLPGALQGQKGVLVRPDGGDLIDLPEDQPGDNAINVELQLTQDARGTVTGSCRAVLRGVDAAFARALLARPTSTTDKQLQALLLGDDSGAPDVVRQITLKKPSVLKSGAVEDMDAPLTLVLEAEPLFAVDDVRPFDIVPERFAGRPMAYLWREGRKAPVVLPHRGVAKVKLSVKLPAGKGVAELPASLQKNGSIFAVEEQWAIADGTFWVARTLSTKERIVPPERYDELRAAATALWGRQQQVVRVVDGGDRGANYNGDPF